MTQTRRDFLKIAAMISGSAGISGFIPESIRRALAIEPEPGSTYRDAEHVVILMQENRSFDHALGTLQGVRGFNDPRALRLANGNSVFIQTDAAGRSYSPWRLDIRDTRITWMGSVPHTRHSQVDAWNEGQHDGWLEAKRSYSKEYAEIPLTMGHYTREDLPFYYALADAFTVCDQSYSSVMSSTTPNRCMFWTGTIRDQQRRDSKVFMRNDEILIGGMDWKTYPERLQEAGISWKFYQNELTTSGGFTSEEEAWLSNFGCNILEYFAAYNIHAYANSAPFLQRQLATLTGQIEKARGALSNTSDPRAATRLRARIEINQAHIKELKVLVMRSSDDSYRELTSEQRALHDAAFVTNAKDADYRSLESLSFHDQGELQQMAVPKGDVLYQFRKDVQEGKLPTVSWLTAPEHFSDHPMSPWYGAWYVSEVMDILTTNPEVWKKTIFILTYDENDGYFDHAPSFVAADPKRPLTGGASDGIDTRIEYTYAQDELEQGVPEGEARGGPIGMGFRVPTIIASPWSRGGWVNSQLFDHTLTLMFLENFVQQKFGKNVREENISSWRRAVAGDLTSCFRPHVSKEPAIHYLDRDKFVVTIQQARFKEIPLNYNPLTLKRIAEINSNPLRTEAVTHQEPGVRPSCALPYELYAHGGLNRDGTAVVLSLSAGNNAHGSRSVGAPFNVYMRNLRAGANLMQAATYVVKAGALLAPSFPLTLFANGHYLIDVHGPNGFYRSFTGQADSKAPQIELCYHRRGPVLTGNLEVHLQNPHTEVSHVVIADNAYKAATIRRQIQSGSDESVVIPLKQSHGWYDLTITAIGRPGQSRFAGRVETGESSFSDPFMGG